MIVNGAAGALPVDRARAVRMVRAMLAGDHRVFAGVLMETLQDERGESGLDAVVATVSVLASDLAAALVQQHGAGAIRIADDTIAGFELEDRLGL